MNFFNVIVFASTLLIVRCDTTSGPAVKVNKTLNDNKIQSVMGDLFSIVRQASNVKFSDLNKILTSLRSGFMGDEAVVNESTMEEDYDDMSERGFKEKRDLLDEEADDIVLLLRKALKSLLDNGSLAKSTTRRPDVSTNNMLKMTNVPEVLMAATQSSVSTESNAKSLGEQIGSNKFVKFLKMTLDTLLGDVKIDQDQKLFSN
ncbi:hypothetical protein BpHYR1_010453 [Brachionus plicatilis]|uniref:Uncharacterized protein n=1 Tax=Brachionus plicatilis TaxID=10195 RepID=A0A3M7SL89_BRAPC|nr:hypothetical protein BpHYR1_010453 [Brachionus plicatilis]